LQALCTLDGLDGLSINVIRAAFEDSHFAIRRHAVRIAESRLNKWPELAATVDFLASDTDPFVKIQVAYSLGEWNDAERTSGLTKILLSNTDDPYLTAAALSSVNKETVGQVLGDVLAAGEDASGLRDRVLSMAAAMGQDEALVTSVKVILRPQPSSEYAPWQFTTVAAIQESLVRRKTNLRKLLDSTGQAQLDALVTNAWQTVVAEAGQPNPTVEPFAIAAMSVLGRGLSAQNEQVHVDVLTSLLAPRYSPEIRAASVAALVRSGKALVPASLLAGWSAHGPSLRNQILDALATREDWSLALLSAVEKGDIPAWQFDARRRQQFVTSRSKAVREKAEKVLAGAVDPNRQKLVETYLAAAAGARGDAMHGKAAFVKRCANCHKLEGAGSAVGPDLAPLVGRPADYLLTSILDPNRAVEDRYVEYVALTTDGRQLTGILVEETGASLTLAAPEGKTFTISRSELEQIKSSGKSLMPEGIERDVTPAEMTDILAYLKKAAPAPKRLALNQPEVVQPFNDGSIRLFASNCRAYGPTIKMEEQFHALGWWNSTDDYCAWSFDVPPGAGGDYRVTLEYSCADDSAGNTAVVEANGQSLTGKVVGSGGWEKYRGWNIGTLKLAEGRGEIVVRSSGPIKNALFDLGGMRLAPVR
jgi:putative heme-binding domain-containing protein